MFTVPLFLVDSAPIIPSFEKVMPQAKKNEVFAAIEAASESAPHFAIQARTSITDGTFVATVRLESLAEDQEVSVISGDAENDPKILGALILRDVDVACETGWNAGTVMHDHNVVLDLGTPRSAGPALSAKGLTLAFDLPEDADPADYRIAVMVEVGGRTVESAIFDVPVAATCVHCEDSMFAGEALYRCGNRCAYCTDCATTLSRSCPRGGGKMTQSKATKDASKELLVDTLQERERSLPAGGTLTARDPANLRQQVWDAELDFAGTMAVRDHDAFTSLLSADAIFFTGGKTLRGREAVSDGWKPYYEGRNAPFSWEPDTVEVLDSGDLALSTGPVTAPDGTHLGRFQSIWRLEADGWRIVFDRGEGQ